MRLKSPNLVWSLMATDRTRANQDVGHCSETKEQMSMKPLDRINDSDLPHKDCLIFNGHFSFLWFSIDGFVSNSTMSKLTWPISGDCLRHQIKIDVICLLGE